MGSLFLVTTKGRCSLHPQVFDHSGTPAPLPNPHHPCRGFSGLGVILSIIVSVLPYLLLLAHYTDSNSGWPYRFSQHPLPSPGSPQPPSSNLNACSPSHLETPPLLASPTKGSSHSLYPLYPGFSYNHHPHWLLPPAPPPLPGMRPLPCSHRSCLPHCTDENGEASVGRWSLIV